MAHRGASAVGADDHRRRRAAGVGVPRARALGQFRHRTMKQYLELMRRIRTEGVRKSDRTGTGTLSVFAHQMRFDLGRGFPLVTTRKIHLRSLVYELLWFLRGDTNVAWLEPQQLDTSDRRWIFLVVTSGKDRQSTHLNSSHTCISYSSF